MTGIVIGIVLALAVAAFIHREKLKPLVEDLKARFRHGTKTAESAVVRQNTYVDPPIPQPDLEQVTKAINFLRPLIDPIKSANLLMRMGRGLYPHEEAYARAQGVVFVDAAPVGPIDRSGNDISDGSPRTFVLSDGQEQTVTFNRGGKVRVLGHAGTQLRSLTDDSGTRVLAGTNQEYEREFSGPGSYTFSVTATGHDVMVRLL